MSSAFLQQLLSRRDTWRGRDLDGAARGGRPTGFAGLDRLLSQGGWPAQGLVELLCPLPCPPLLHLLLPALAGDQPGARLIANPPERPSALALARAGVPLERLLVLHGERDGLLRACYEAAASDTVATLLLWAPGGALPAGTLRRLHLGAQQGRCLLVLARPRRAARQPSPAPLRLELDCLAPGELTVTVHKQPGGRPGERCHLSLLPEHLRRPPPATATLPALTRRPAAAHEPTPALPGRPAEPPGREAPRP
ncbi:MAG: SOS cell division inhibitor [Alcanivorax sp.]|nr:SOS cell division inhibitor [Alcanivorax sp.]MBI55125.1 SOS cell division inhibitor [Alcanivorax sp.]|tara:strand:+ start:7410 stop:8168 length:759 start_codon:yes stop_codon:yes gene_type:complete